MTVRSPDAARSDASWAGDRAVLAAFVGILAGLNAISGSLIEAFIQRGAINAVVNLAGISAGVWFAFAGCYIIAREDGHAEPALQSDLIVAGGVCLAALVPFPEASALAVLAAGLFYAWSSSAGSRTRRIGIVLLAVSGTLIWGRLVLAVFSPILLPLDGALVASLAGTEASGNLVAFVDGRHFVIGKGCSSVHNLTFAVLLWGTLTQMLSLPITRRLIVVCLVAMLATAFVNVLRLASMALFPQSFDYIHTGDGGAYFGWTSMLVAAAIVGAGAYVEARRSV